MAVIAPYLDRGWRVLRSAFSPNPVRALPEQAYDLWAATYDTQPHNLLLAMEQKLFARMLQRVSLHNCNVIDVGCGTGRHWPSLFQQKPARLKGYDVSEQMLSILAQKFPGADVCRSADHLMVDRDQSYECLVSTLTLAHIADAELAVAEWCRVLKPGGDMLITDYHPEALQKGGHRTFAAKGRTYAIRSFVYPVEAVLHWFEAHGVQLVDFAEEKIGPGNWRWFEEQDALGVYHKFEGTPVVYAMQLKKKG